MNILWDSWAKNGELYSTWYMASIGAYIITGTYQPSMESLANLSTLLIFHYPISHSQLPLLMALLDEVFGRSEGQKRKDVQTKLLSPNGDQSRHNTTYQISHQTFPLATFPFIWMGFI